MMWSEQYVELAELAGSFIHEIKNHLSTLGLNLQLLAEDFAEPQSQRGASLWLGVLLLLLGAAVALLSARQFRQVLRNLDPAVVPPGYWTHMGVALNVAIACIATVFALRFLWPDQ